MSMRVTRRSLLVAAPHDEPLGLEAVEVADEGGAADAHAGGELALAGALVALDGVREHDPHRQAAAVGGEVGLEPLAHRLGR